MNPDPAGVGKYRMQELRSQIEEALGTDGRVSIRRDPAGALLIGVVREAEEEEGDATSEVRTALTEAGVVLPDKALLVVYEPGSEPKWLETGYRVLPTWSEALGLEPGMQKPPEQPPIAETVVAFWGVKGGVGRSTALINCAARIARGGKRVLVADLDLDAPTLVGTWCPELVVPVRFDDLLDAASAQGEDLEFKQKVASAIRVGPPLPDGVALLGADFADEQHVRSLLGRLPPTSLFRGKESAPRVLLRVAAEIHQADVVLIDTRAGYSEESAMVIFDLADSVVLFASAAPSTYVSMAAATRAVERAHISWGRPRHVHYVLGMMPAGAEARRLAREELLAVANEARAETVKALGVSSEELSPDVEPVEIDYLPVIVENDGSLQDEARGYVLLTERLAPPKPALPVKAVAADWLERFYTEWNAESVVAEDAEIEVLAQIFTRTSEMERLGRREIPVILGPKGSGKTMLRRLCLERPDLVTPFFRSPGLTPLFVDAFSQKRTTSKLEFRADLLGSIDAKLPASGVWSAIALLRAAERLLASGAIDPFESPAVEALFGQFELDNAISHPTRRLALVQELARRGLAMDTAWQELASAAVAQGRELILIFDDLDTALGLEEDAIEPRARLIAGLIDRLDRSWTSRTGLQAKVFLRADLLRRSGIEEGAKFQGSRALKLEWDAPEIWRFLVRFVLAAAPSFADGLVAADVPTGQERELTEEDARRGLSLLWGERMGERESSTRSLVWVQKRLTDGKGRIFPRAAGWFVDSAVQLQKATRPNTSPPAIGPTALRGAIRGAAGFRLAELENEASSMEKRYLRCLRGAPSYQNLTDFEKHLQNGGVPPEDVARAKQLLQELGVIEFGQRQDKTPTVRIVDLYAFAKDLEVDRLGRQ